MATPKWATDLTALIEKDLNIPPIKVTWRRYRDSFFSSGKAIHAQRRIVVTAGRQRTDQHRTLLHEIAHILTPGCKHNSIFYTVAWELYDRYAPRISRKTLLWREGTYRKTALTVALRRGVPGAATVLHQSRPPRRTKS